MPYKRRSYRKKPYKRTMKRKLRQFIRRPEIKYFSYSNSANVSTSGQLQDITATLVQGDDYTNRAGRQIFLRWLHVNVTMASADTVQYVRIGLYKYQRGRASGATDGFPADYLGWHDPIKVTKIRDKLIKGQSNAAPNTDFNKIVRFKVPIFKKLYFTGTGNDAATDAYYLYFMSDSSVINHPLLTWSYRLSFNDM